MTMTPRELEDLGVNILSNEVMDLLKIDHYAFNEGMSFDTQLDITVEQLKVLLHI